MNNVIVPNVVMQQAWKNGVHTRFAIKDASHFNFSMNGFRENTSGFMYEVQASYLNPVVDALFTKKGFDKDNFSRLADLGTRCNKIHLERQNIHCEDIMEMTVSEAEKLTASIDVSEREGHRLYVGETLNVYSEFLDWKTSRACTIGFYVPEDTRLVVGHYLFNHKDDPLGEIKTSVALTIRTGWGGKESRSIRSFDELHSLFNAENPIKYIAEERRRRAIEIKERGGLLE